MSYTVSDLKNDLSGELHGTNIDDITGVDLLIYRAARKVLADVDPMETKRITPITNAVFNSVYDYSLPTDLKGNRIIDIRPQVNRSLTQVFSQWYNQSFDVQKLTSQLDSFTVQYNSSVKTIRINAPDLTAPTIINACDGISNNGTWAVGSSASSLAEDSVNFVSSAASLSFNLAASGSTGYLENSTMTAQDLSDFTNQGTLFLYTYLPTASNFTNVKLRWGSSSANYYEVTATTTQAGNSFANGWNLLSFAWNGATTTGTPDDTAINYARVTWTYDGTAQTAVRLDNITIALGTIFEIEYYSKYMFRSAAGTWQETISADTDIINLDTDSYDLLLYSASDLAVQQQQGLDALFHDGAYFLNKYNECLLRYMSKYKSEVQKPQSIYYGIRKPSRIVPWLIDKR